LVVFASFAALNIVMDFFKLLSNKRSFQNSDTSFSRQHSRNKDTQNTQSLLHKKHTEKIKF